MAECKAIISLNDIGLEKCTEDMFINTVQIIIDKASSKYNKAEGFVVSIPRTEASIVEGAIEKNDQNSIKTEASTKRATTEERLTSTKLDASVKKYLINAIATKGLKTVHINDIIKTCLDTSAANLGTDAQMTLVSHIVDNRNQNSIKNCEYASTLLVKEGCTDERNLENWIAHILRLLNEIIESLSIEETAYTALSSEQKQQLCQELNKLKRYIEDKLAYFQ